MSLYYTYRPYQINAKWAFGGTGIWNSPNRHAYSERFLEEEIFS